ncbi:MAG: hypothetical protein CMN90_12885 [Sutterellaceae bacterium]|nr:hypothetical protein [Sutterellaceae bacterium]MAZ10554.1 hypothetical protein [Sutterellaceae bacterium]
MSTQVIGSVNELEGPVSIMRDGETRSLAAGDSIMAGDVITASDSGRASIILSNSYGEPIGNLLVAPTGSVIADTTLKNGQTALVFEALSDDGVTIANLDPDFAEMVELQGVDQAGSEGGMFGLFGGGFLAGGSMGGTAAAVGAGAVGLGLLASSSDDEGSGPTSSTGGGTVGDSDGGSDGGGDDGGGDTGGTTGTPLDAVLDPVLDALAGTPLVAVTEPLADALGMLGDAAGGADGGETDGPTGTPLDAVLGPLADAAGGAGGGSTGGTTGTPLDAALDPLLGMAADSPLAPITSMLDPAIITDAIGGGLPV